MTLRAILRSIGYWLTHEPEDRLPQSWLEDIERKAAVSLLVIGWTLAAWMLWPR